MVERVYTIQYFVVSSFAVSSDNCPNNNFSVHVIRSVSSKRLTIFGVEYNFDKTFCMSGRWSLSRCLTGTCLLSALITPSLACFSVSPTINFRRTYVQPEHFPYPMFRLMRIFLSLLPHVLNTDNPSVGSTCAVPALEHNHRSNNSLHVCLIKLFYAHFPLSFFFFTADFFSVRFFRICSPWCPLHLIIYRFEA